VPLTFLSFTAYAQTGKNNVLLYWNTANEINTKDFVLEQSTDGIHFIAVANVAAKGYGANSYAYTVTDNIATYYRLKMADNNGQYAYSKIVSINSMQNEEGISILNNPAASFVTIKNNIVSLNNTTAKILDSHGAVVKTFVLHAGLQDVGVSNLTSGGYYIQTSHTSLKFIIAR